MESTFAGIDLSRDYTDEEIQELEEKVAREKARGVAIQAETAILEQELAAKKAEVAENDRAINYVLGRVSGLVSQIQNKENTAKTLLREQLKQVMEMAESPDMEHRRAELATLEELMKDITMKDAEKEKERWIAKRDGLRAKLATAKAQLAAEQAETRRIQEHGKKMRQKYQADITELMMKAHEAEMKKMGMFSQAEIDAGLKQLKSFYEGDDEEGAAGGSA